MPPIRTSNSSSQARPEQPIVHLKPNPLCLFLKSPWKTCTIIISCLLILGLIPNTLKWFRLKTTNYFITTKQIIIDEGVFDKKHDQTLLFRIRDLEIRRPFLYRFFDLCDLYIYSSDMSKKIKVMRGISFTKAKKLMDILTICIKRDRGDNRPDIGLQ